MLQITDHDIRAKLRKDNPWWDGPIDSRQAPYGQPRRFYHRALGGLIDEPVRRAVILLGARRVGKTTLLLQLIGERVARYPILFASLDTPTYAGLPPDRLIALFEKEVPHDPRGPRLVVFDEVQYLRDWERHLKTLVDRNPATKFVASGSAAAALKRKSDESGAGRFTEFVLPSLAFAEFVAFRGHDAMIRESIAEPGRYEAVDIEALNREFVDYLNFGGFPEVVTTPAIAANIEQFVGRDIVDKVLLRDLPALYGITDTQELNRLFAVLAYNTGQEINLETLAQNAGVTKVTIGRYLEYLEAAFLIFRVRRIDESARRFARQRTFKTYLANPSLRAALFGPLRDGDDALGHLAETALFSQWRHRPDFRDVRFARWAGAGARPGGEVDLVLLHRATERPQLAIEIKWSDRMATHDKDRRALLDFARKNRLERIAVTTRAVSREVEAGGITFSLMPLSLLCYQLVPPRSETVDPVALVRMASGAPRG